MAFLQFAVILALAAVASAGVIGAPVAAVGPVGLDSWAYPRYSFNYGVSDAVTGDNHGRWETRDGDVTKGGYQLVEPDGTIRLVEYTSDPINGFNAVVKKGPGASVHSAVPAIAAAPVAAFGAGAIAAGAPGWGGLGLGAGGLGYGAAGLY